MSEGSTWRPGRFKIDIHVTYKDEGVEEARDARLLGVGPALLEATGREHVGTLAPAECLQLQR